MVIIPDLVKLNETNCYIIGSNKNYGRHTVKLIHDPTDRRAQTTNTIEYIHAIVSVSLQIYLIFAHLHIEGQVIQIFSNKSSIFAATEKIGMHYSIHESFNGAFFYCSAAFEIIPVL